MASQPQQDFEEQDDDIEVVQAPGNDDDDGGDPEPSEEQARRLGWKPKDEFKGDESQWRDWQDFLNEDLSNAPQLKATVKLLKRRLDQADRRARKIEQTLEESKGYWSRTEERAYNKAVADIRKTMRQAAAIGDTETYNEAEAELDEITEEKTKAPAQTAKMAEDDRTFRKWKRENDWYETDDAMTGAADRIAQKMGPYAETGMEWDEYLEELTARVKKEFPHKFAAPVKKRSAVEGVAETRSTKGQETFDNLPSEWKQQFKRFEDMGIPVKKESFTKDAWGEINKEKRR